MGITEGTAGVSSGGTVNEVQAKPSPQVLYSCT